MDCRIELTADTRWFSVVAEALRQVTKKLVASYRMENVRLKWNEDVSFKVETLTYSLTHHTSNAAFRRCCRDNCNCSAISLLAIIPSVANCWTPEFG
jgi:hypothetical protein